MSNFSNPYAPIPGDMMEQKTSVLAIIALVCSVTCIPAILGVILAVIALVMIAGSNGRLGGRGLAIAALIIGLIFAALQLGIAVATSQGLGMFSSVVLKPAGEVMTAVEGQRYDEARKAMITGAGERVKDADFDRFRTGYQSELGAFKGMAQGISSIFGGYSQLGPIMQPYQGQQQGQQPVIPLPGQFEKGWALIVVQVDPSQGQNNAVMPANIIVHAPSGSKWMLYEGKDTGATTGTPTTGTTDGSITLPSPPGTTIRINPGTPKGAESDAKPTPTQQPTPQPTQEPTPAPTSPR